MRSFLLNVSWKDEILGLNKIFPLIESYSEGSVARNPSLPSFLVELAEP